MVNNKDQSLRRILLDIPLEDYYVACDEAERLDSSPTRIIASWIHKMAMTNKEKLREQVSKNIGLLLDDLRKGGRT